MTQQQVLSLLEEKRGDDSWASLAERIGVSRAYLSDILRGRRDPGPTILEFLGLRKVVSYTVKYERKG